jgi:2-hydroxychromene-2-carboxylate isomerase
MKPNVVFWYEFASTYSYLSALRIEDAGQRAGISIEWRPFLLGPIFKSQGWTTSPFKLYPVKGRYMVRDIARRAASRGWVFRMPAMFPANSLKATRLAIAAQRYGATPAFSRAVFEAEFAFGQDISSDEVLANCLTAADLDPGHMLALSSEADVKDALRRNTEAAQAMGIFGSPSFTTPDNELFWGDDRLDQALDWALNPPRREPPVVNA